MTQPALDMLTRRLVRVERIEQLTGLHLWPKLNRDDLSRRWRPRLWPRN